MTNANHHVQAAMVQLAKWIWLDFQLLERLKDGQSPDPAAHATLTQTHAQVSNWMDIIHGIDTDNPHMLSTMCLLGDKYLEDSASLEKLAQGDAALAKYSEVHRRIYLALTNAKTLLNSTPPPPPPPVFGPPFPVINSETVASLHDWVKSQIQAAQKITDPTTQLTEDVIKAETAYLVEAVEELIRKQPLPTPGDIRAQVNAVDELLSLQTDIDQLISLLQSKIGTNILRVLDLANLEA